MKLVSHIIQRRLKLSPPLTRDLVVQRDLRVPMPDGAVLLADRWAPRSGGEGLPTALIRTPYGRRGPFGMILARPLAERGYQVLIQSVRGGFGSGGTFDPMRQERADGLATLDWMVQQPWFGEAIVLYGLSYLGYVQTGALARDYPQYAGRRVRFRLECASAPTGDAAAMLGAMRDFAEGLGIAFALEISC